MWCWWGCGGDDGVDGDDGVACGGVGEDGEGHASVGCDVGDGGYAVNICDVENDDAYGVGWWCG